VRILALDAALGPCSAALVEDGVLLAQHRSDDPRGASAALPGLVASVLSDSPGGFAAIAVTVGPGSFTGVRAALALAHGLALGAAVPITGVTSMEAIAAACPPVAGRALWVAIDTRRARIFLGRGEEITVVAPDDLPDTAGPVALAGDAAQDAAARLTARGHDVMLTGIGGIDAHHVGLAGAQRLGGAMALREAQPLYVEPPEARPAAMGRPAPA
jgi:tRNA threonylcarbamoyladenosine biosynthesis protein TsaB